MVQRIFKVKMAQIGEEVSLERGKLVRRDDGFEVLLRLHGRLVKIATRTTEADAREAYEKAVTTCLHTSLRS